MCELLINSGTTGKQNIMASTPSSQNKIQGNKQPGLQKN